MQRLQATKGSRAKRQAGKGDQRRADSCHTLTLHPSTTARAAAPVPSYAKHRRSSVDGPPRRDCRRLPSFHRNSMVGSCRGRRAEAAASGNRNPASPSPPGIGPTSSRVCQALSGRVLEPPSWSDDRGPVREGTPALEPLSVRMRTDESATPDVDLPMACPRRHRLLSWDSSPPPATRSPQPYSS